MPDLPPEGWPDILQIRSDDVVVLEVEDVYHSAGNGDVPNNTRSLKWGTAPVTGSTKPWVAGRTCACASDEDIANCLANAPNLANKVAPFYYKLTATQNCMTDSKQAMDGCCLNFKKGNTPWILEMAEEIERAKAAKAFAEAKKLKAKNMIGR